MAEPSSIQCNNSQLEQFLLLAKSAKGNAANSLIEQAVAANGLFVFAELLNHANIKKLETLESTKKHYQLLQLFAYGSYGDYKANESQFPVLTAPMVTKLRQLTIVTLAATNRRIPYDTLQTVLDVKNVRELEDLIIDAIYKGLIQGKLDPMNRRLEVQYCRGRDVRTADVKAMMAKLIEWSDTCRDALSELERQIEVANGEREASVHEQQRIEQELVNIKKTLKTTGGRSQTPDMDDSFHPDVGAAVSSSTGGGVFGLFDKKKEVKRHKGSGGGGLRGSANRAFFSTHK